MQPIKFFEVDRMSHPLFQPQLILQNCLGFSGLRKQIQLLLTFIFQWVIFLNMLNHTNGIKTRHLDIYFSSLDLEVFSNSVSE